MKLGFIKSLIGLLNIDIDFPRVGWAFIFIIAITTNCFKVVHFICLVVITVLCLVIINVIH